MDKKQQLPQYIQELVAEFITREVELPEGTLATVTKVDVSGNHRHANVWISILPEDKADECMQILTRQLYGMQGEINEKVQSHPAPRLGLKVDHGPAHASHIEEILENLDE